MALFGDSIDDPRTAAMFAAAQALLGRGGNMQRIAGAGADYVGSMERAKTVDVERQRRMAETLLMQMRAQEFKRQQEAEQAAAQRRTGIEGAYMRAIETPAQQALAGGGGPTVANAEKMPGLAPRVNQDVLVQELMKVDPVSAAKMLMPDPEEAYTLGPGQARFVGGRQVAAMPQEPEKINPNQPFMVVNGEIVPNPAYQAYELEKASRGAARQVVTIGDKQYGEEGSLRKEFNDLPEVKRYNSAYSAYNAIKSASTRPGSQSEINMIYGLAKLYDPESVVREGEYATIANSQSIPEWLKGMAQHLTTGGKLTAATKAQIVAEADARIKVLKSQKDAARQSYQGVVERRGLDPRNVFIGEPDVIDFNSLPTGK